MIPEWDLNDTKTIASQTGVEHILLEEETIDADIKMNPVNRCYFFKKVEFRGNCKYCKRTGFSCLKYRQWLHDAACQASKINKI